jgi:rhodanese-related sulfurtransferase
MEPLVAEADTGQGGRRIIPIRRRLFRQDLGWAAFILVIAVIMGLTYHWRLAEVAFRGELTPYLEKLRAQQRQVQFQGVKTVSLAQAYDRYQSGQSIFIDARPPDEYAELHVPGAINFPPDRLESAGEAAVAGIAKERQIVVYCGQASCDAALKVAEKLQSLGYTRVSAFMGGFRAWDEAGYPADTGK